MPHRESNGSICAVPTILLAIVQGLVGTAILSLFGLTARFVRDRTIQRRYPVAGHYLSSYEDHDEGQIIQVKADMVFRQRGRRVWGVTSDLDDSRRWRLEGRVDDGGRIWGKYGADTPHDPGTGGFFLEMRSDGSLEGLWSGYDASNGGVQAGKYTFRPAVGVKSRAANASDLDESLALLGRALGPRYVTRQALTSYMADAEVNKHAFVSRSTSGELVGVATVEIFENSEAFFDQLPVGQKSTIEGLVPNLDYHRIGLVRSVAVASDMQGRGVGTQIVQAAVDWLWTHKSTLILSVGWTDEAGCHIEGVLEGLGFHARGDIPFYWHADSTEKAYDCPSCGRPCGCVARLLAAFRSDTHRQIAIA